MSIPSHNAEHPAKALIEKLLKPLCRHKHEVVARGGMNNTIITIHTKYADAGRVLGTNGFHFHSLKKLVQVIGNCQEMPAILELNAPKTGTKDPKVTVGKVRDYDCGPATEILDEICRLTMKEGYRIEKVESDDTTILEVCPLGNPDTAVIPALAIVMKVYGSATGRPNLEVRRAGHESNRA